MERNAETSDKFQDVFLRLLTLFLLKREGHRHLSPLRRQCLVVALTTGVLLARALVALALGAACAPTARVSAATRIRGLKFIV